MQIDQKPSKYANGSLYDDISAACGIVAAQQSVTHLLWQLHQAQLYDVSKSVIEITTTLKNVTVELDRAWRLLDDLRVITLEAQRQDPA